MPEPSQNTLMVLGSSIILQTQTPPAEFRIWQFGTVSTDKGVFNLTDQLAKFITQTAKAKGNKLPIDYQHGMISTEGNPVPAAGWFDLEVRADGLWAVNVEWTPKASDMLIKGEYRYYSPAFFANLSGDIVGLVNIALTNLPATHNLQKIAASQTFSGGHMNPNLSQVLVTLGITTEAEAVTRATQLVALEQITGKKGDEALKTLQAWKTSHEQAHSLSQKLETIAEERRKEQITTMVDTAQKEGKLPPALRQWALSQTHENLTVYLQSVGTQVPAGGATPAATTLQKAWKEMTGYEKAELYVTNQDLYNQLRLGAK